MVERYSYGMPHFVGHQENLGARGHMRLPKHLLARLAAACRCRQVAMIAVLAPACRRA